MSGNGNNGRNGKTFGSFPVRVEFRATASFNERIRELQRKTGVSMDRIVREAAARGLLDTSHSLLLEKRLEGKNLSERQLRDLRDTRVPRRSPPDPAFLGEQ